MSRKMNRNKAEQKAGKARNKKRSGGKYRSADALAKEFKRSVKQSTDFLRKVDVANVVPQISPETIRKLNRSKMMSLYMEVASASGNETDKEIALFDLMKRHLISYIHDDICAVIEEIKAKGLYKAGGKHW